MLTRTAYQDDTSVYKMNGKTCPYKEVAKALRKYGIDLEHSRFLILQVSFYFLIRYFSFKICFS